MTAAAAPFGRVLTAMATPFTDDGAVDLEATARVATHLADNGNDGIVVSGTTGESPTTDAAEDGQILRAVIDAVGDRCTVVAGVGTNNTAHSVELAEQARRLGADGLLVVTPYYNKPTQSGVAAHMEAVAEAGGLPVLLYDIPGRTGLQIAEETYAHLARHEHVVAVKDAVGDLFRGVRIMTETGLVFYSGEDELNLAWLVHGAAGVVSVVGHVAGRRYAAMVEAVDAGDLAGALGLYQALVPVVDAVMHRAPGAATAKAALQLLGVLDNRATRLPLRPADDSVVDHLRKTLSTAGLLEDRA